MIRRAEAGICRTLTSAVLVRSQISSCGIYGGQSGTETGTGLRFADVSIIPPVPYNPSNGATARGGPRPPSRVSSILLGLGRLFSNFYTLALLHK